MQGRSNSTKNQKEYLEDFARKNGFRNIRHFTDDGVSGITFEREGFQKMIAGVEAWNVGTAIIKDMSRFGRNYLKAGFYTKMFFPKRVCGLLLSTTHGQRNAGRERFYTIPQHYE